LWAGFNPLGVKEGIFVLFHGYIDESFDSRQNVFAFSCLIAKGKAWSEMERKWKLYLTAKNRELHNAGRPQISRYHASDCSGRREEFKGWTHDERDAFVLSLFGLFKQFPSHTVVFDVQLDEICEVFPEWGADRLKAAYYLLTLFLMNQVRDDFAKLSHDEHVRITLFHDRTGGNGEYDPTILRAFNSQVNDPNFAHAEYFTTIAPLSWENCVALQPADLVAFECFKEADARIQARDSRKSYKALLDMETFGIHSMTMGKPAILRLREVLEKSDSLPSLTDV
jgi:hypothetical protein